MADGQEPEPIDFGWLIQNDSKRLKGLLVLEEEMLNPEAPEPP